MADFNCRVSGFVLNDYNEVLIIKRNADFIPDSKEHVGWEICGGGIEHGETPEEALIREYKEETGLDIGVTSLINARTGFRDGKNLLVLAYMGEHVSGDVQLTNEHVEYKWVAIPELKGYDFGEHTSMDLDKFLALF